MNLFSKLALTAVTSVLLLLGGIFTGEKLYQPVASSQVSFGSFSPVQGQTYTLQGAGVTATQNTVPLASFTTPDGRAITMAMFGGTIGYGTLEPNTNSKIEDITFSGITQNSNGTAVLTGVTRGNDFVTPYNASTTLAKAHAGGSYFILSNTAGFYGQQFLFANNTSTSTAVMVFSSTTPPRYDADPIWGNFTTQVLADVSYVNSVVAAGAANGSETVKGIYQLATAAQAALGTSVGSTGARLALGNNLATSTPGLSTATGNIPISVGRFILQTWLDLTAPWTFSTTTSYNANFGRIVATSTIASSFQNASSTLFTANTLYATTVNFPTGCTNCTITAAIATSTTFNSPSGSVGSGSTGSVFCVAPRIVAGGFYSGIPSPTNPGSGSGVSFVIPTASSVSGSTYTLSLVCGGNSTGTCSPQSVTITALCVNP